MRCLCPKGHYFSLKGPVSRCPCGEEPYWCTSKEGPLIETPVGFNLFREGRFFTYEVPPKDPSWRRFIPDFSLPRPYRVTLTSPEGRQVAEKEIPLSPEGVFSGAIFFGEEIRAEEERLGRVLPENGPLPDEGAIQAVSKALDGVLSYVPQDSVFCYSTRDGSPITGGQLREMFRRGDPAALEFTVTILGAAIRSLQVISKFRGSP